MIIVPEMIIGSVVGIYNGKVCHLHRYPSGLTMERSGELLSIVLVNYILHLTSSSSEYYPFGHSSYVLSSVNDSPSNLLLVPWSMFGV